MATGLSFRQEDGKVSLCVFCGPSLSDTVPLKSITGGGAHSLSAVGLVRFRNQKGVELVVSRASIACPAPAPGATAVDLRAGG